jgi:hypothetical protein
VRELSAPFLEAILSRTGEGRQLMLLLTVTHVDLPEPIRVCLNTVPITSRGNVFHPYPFRITLPEEREEQASHSKLVIDGVDRTMVAVLRTVSTPPEVVIELVLSTSLDLVEYFSAPMRWRGISYTVTMVEGLLEGPRIFYSRFPRDVFSPNTTPGVFYGGPNI